MSLTHYYMEILAAHKQVEIEKQAREAWKFVYKKDSKQPNSILENKKNAKKSVLVEQHCCGDEC